MLWLRRTCVSVTALCFLSLGFGVPANGAVIGTEAYLAAAERAARVAQVQAVLARDEVRSQLVTLGVDPDEALARVAHLTEQELATVAGQLENLPAGGSDALAVIGIVFLVLLILELTGVIDIFKKI